MPGKYSGIRLGGVVAGRPGAGAGRGRWRGDARGAHHAVDRGDGLGGGLEVAGAEALRDQQRRPAVLVLPVPDARSSPPCRRGTAPSSAGSCRRRRAWRSRRSRPRRSRRRPRLRRYSTASSASGSVPASSVRRERADAGRGHQRRAAVLVRQQRVGAQLDQQLHVRQVGGLATPAGTASRRSC